MSYLGSQNNVQLFVLVREESLSMLEVHDYNLDKALHLSLVGFDD